MRIESLRAVRQIGGDVLVTVREALPRVDLAAIEDRTHYAAGTLEPRVLRALDAIHVATLGDDIDTVVTYDERMAWREGARPADRRAAPG